MPATITKTDEPIPGSGDGSGRFDDLPGYGGDDGENRKPEPERQPPPWMITMAVAGTVLLFFG